MKKKAILIVAALMLVVSGVAAVSAYEAHIVNVKAHVENAIHLTGAGNGPDYELDFGIVFPEEWLTKSFTIGVSDSFCQQSRVTAIQYRIFVEEKADLDVPADPTADPPVIAHTITYAWPGQFMYLGVDPTMAGAKPTAGELTVLGATPGDRPAVKEVFTSAANPEEIDKLTDGDNFDTIWVAIDGPVFAGYYNAASDAIVNPDGKPSGRSTPSYIAPTSWANSEDVGFDLKIQVSNIYKK